MGGNLQPASGREAEAGREPGNKLPLSMPPFRGLLFRTSASPIFHTFHPSTPSPLTHHDAQTIAGRQSGPQAEGDVCVSMVQCLNLSTSQRLKRWKQAATDRKCCQSVNASQWRDVAPWRPFPLARSTHSAPLPRISPGRNVANSMNGLRGSLA